MNLSTTPSKSSVSQKLTSVLKRLRFTLRAAKKMPISRDVSYYVRCTKSLPIDEHLVFYESHNGAGLVCNPYAVFRALIADPTHARLKHVWALDSAEELRLRSHEYRRHTNVRFVLRGGRDYLRALATAKYLIQNTSFPSYFAKRDGQVYVNTWHSITVKTLGYDMPGGNYNSRNMVRNLLMADYVLSPNSFMTGVLRTSYRLDGLFRGKILELGYPRVDSTANARRQEVLDRLRERGVEVDPAKKIVLYAPTWRGRTVHTVDADTETMLRLHRVVSAGIDTGEYQVLVKPHQYQYRVLSEAEKRSGRYIPHQIDANELLSVVDILVSDYSSIFFDFLPTGRPVLFYIPDKAHYTAERGVYFDVDELPGPVTDDPAEIATWINDIDQVAAQHREALESARAWACEHEDGHSSQRVVDVVFGSGSADGKVVEDFVKPDLKRLLFYVSGFGNNGVTASFLALLPHLDRNAYDITVTGIIDRGASAENFEQLRDVRAMARVGTFAVTRWESFGVQYVKRYGFNGPLARILRPQAALRRDFRRCFGDADFDYIIDFSGYGSLFPAVFLQHEGSRKIIWQHADLLAELENTAKRKLPQYRNNTVSKTGLKNIYAAFDRIVACGAAIMEVNRSSLGSEATFEKFTYANNLIDVNRVRRLLGEGNSRPVDSHGIVADRTVFEDGTERVLLLPDSPPAPDSGVGYLKFVTMGRLSPEKNHDSLVRGFASFAEDYPNARLIIIGSGALEKQLRRLAAQLGVGTRVTFTGQLRNPFSVIKACDCFILPSLHEGNVLVVPEVRILGIPVILSRFSSVDSACIPDGQYLIGFSPEDVRLGLQAFVDGLVPRDYTFDVDAHNRAALQQFEDVLAST